MEFVIGEIVRMAVFVEPAIVAFGLRDPDDDVYLATAEAGEAILVTCASHLSHPGCIKNADRSAGTGDGTIFAVRRA